MAYSYLEYVGTAGGTTGPFSYGGPVEYLSSDIESISTQLKVYKNGVLLTFTTDYTINTGAEEITLVNLLFNTDVLRCSRDTRKDSRYVDYVDSTNVTSELLDLDSNQMFFIAQESFDLQADAMIRGTDGQWNSRGFRIQNVGTGVLGTDAVNLNQLNAATSGALPANLSGIGTTVYAGNGSTTAFALPSAIASITDPSDVEVYINGIRQRPTTHYTISSGNVNITPAPASTDNILLAYPEGVVSATLTANSVTTTSIQDDSVTVAKIAQGTNGQVLATVSSNSAWTSLTASFISDFDTQVRTSKLNQMASATGDYSMGSNKITNLATPTASTDAANKSYVDGLIAFSSHSATPSGTSTSISFSANTTFVVGLFTLMVPIVQSSLNHFFTVSGVVTSGLTANPSNPIRIWVPDDDAVSGNYYNVFYTRTGSGNMSFTVTQASSLGSPTITLNSSGTVFVHLAKGSN